MKKNIKLLLVLVTILALLLNACSKDKESKSSSLYTLDQIVTQFNSCEMIAYYSEFDMTLKAEKGDNKITVSLSGDQISADTTFELKDNILSSTITADEAMLGLILLDCIGQLHGYADGESISTFNSDEFQNYTLAKEGLEMKDLGNDSIELKVDLSKKFPLLDMSKVFFEVSDLQKFQESYGENISGDGFCQQGKGNLVFSKTGTGNDAEILIGEKEELTENAYKSILSILEVMFEGKDVVDYFESSYSGFTQGDKEFSGFKIEINPADESDNIMLESYNECARITIDKEQALTLGK